MKTVAAVAMVVFLLSAALEGWRTFTGSDVLIIGGKYTVLASQTLPSNLRALFAQVTLQDGARIEGKITAISSTLDLAGSVDGAVLAVNSDVIVHAGARLAEAPQRVAGIPFVILLPGVLRAGQPNLQQ
jgi:hypothetical protein